MRIYMSVAAKMNDCPLMVVKFLHLYRRYHVTKEEDDISMTEEPKKSQEGNDNTMKVTVTKNGPYIVTGGVPLIQEEICNDEEGYSHTWRKVKEFPVQEQYALCRCGQSKNKPFCDGTHAKDIFNGNETARNESYLRHPRVLRGPELELADYENLCVHARFCMRPSGVWDLTERSDIKEARETAIEEACNCPSGRLVLKERKSGNVIEPDLEKSIVVIENPAREEHGPLWVRGGIPVVSADGKPYTVRNRMTLCRCGKSCNKPFCDGSHVQY
jgi:CDGSH-type Zn-finger protein